MIPPPINLSLQKQRTNLIAQKMKTLDYDLIFFQEAFLKSFRKKITSELKEIYPYQVYLPREHKPWKFMNSGLFILSRHPIEVLDYSYFKKCTHSDCLASKGVLLIEATLPQGERVQFATTHTQAWDDQKAQKMRALQFSQIKNVLARNSKPGIPQILLGDLNIDGNATHEFPFIKKLMAMDSIPLTGEHLYTNGYPIECYKSPGGSPRQWLDHVWLQSNESGATLQSNEVKIFTGLFKNKECPLSDHYAIESKIQL